jgi:hypothetical protein
MASGNASCASAAPRAARAIGGTRIDFSALLYCVRLGAGWWIAATRRGDGGTARRSRRPVPPLSVPHHSQLHPDMPQGLEPGESYRRDQENDDRAQRLTGARASGSAMLKFPTRPLSPRLQIYQPQLTSVLSFAHRLTGVTLGFAPSHWSRGWWRRLRGRSLTRSCTASCGRGSVRSSLPVAYFVTSCISAVASAICSGIQAAALSFARSIRPGGRWWRRALCSPRPPGS